MKQSIYRSSPKYTLGSRAYPGNYYSDYDRSPGPCYSIVHHVNKSPAYSFGIKHSEKKNLFYVYNRD